MLLFPFSAPVGLAELALSPILLSDEKTETYPLYLSVQARSTSLERDLGVFEVSC